MRWAVAETDGGGARLCPLYQDGRPAGPVVHEVSVAEAVGSRPDVERWVWRSTGEMYRRLLAAGVRVERCYDVEAAEALLIGHEEGQSGQARSLAAAWARLHGLPVPPDAPARAAETQPSLFESGPVPLPSGTDELTALLEVYAGQIARTAKTEQPERMRLLLAAESAGMLVAAEMSRTGIPWRADVHREVLDELLGERFPGGGEPRRMAELADRVSRAFGDEVRVRPDLPNDIIRAFARAGIFLSSTRKWELQQVDHPAVAPLLEYKSLYRLYTAHGWSWLEQWVHDGRFRPEYLPGGTVSGRWTTNGGGALQIPKVIRRAVRADPGWCLVVADADQMEPRVLAAISRDPGLMEVAGRGEDLYADLAARAFGGDRAQAKLAMLGAIYGQTSGDARTHMAELRRRYPAAMAYVDDAARAGEEGRLVRTWLGRTCPPLSAGAPDDPAEEQEPSGRYGSTSAARARGRFTRNFVVQGSAADWALLVLAALRQQMTRAGLRAELVFFQHDEVIVHCPAEEAATVAEAIATAAQTAGRIAFGPTPVRFPLTTAIVECYWDAK
ncbi:bifunctional 3'-5' exonuclease/DNA polymerase [Nocardia terpenica]|uniref:bifunctional 3'-5' exonuclease/DNA polymerase n=1 Tax=Nocardia terpenica TaxID=455432 RepID=UPI001893F96D|nr:bifunctional 3'-5' exonuclease/DNA polymerase [Nocardia terpenica]MBF6065323.1 bifunctional 3'-5' exonuclease/DNA polymerase [Nocardia terpenica]MBF6108050.1 bifunctional 3'-5' exonuclease/DNA polymerase [Nocardia terpenica]MBF6115419.1 bifunctional 3'-5' exonuclease/DNA polymerase [Nocardia terpenica]MBF6121856.1 bifunctional 3'-5' exonuclease/DNA polymerase [Nocardia terpenica]MBF6155600.1 bifunctional 3'-5' exonuclease/DNA polymerase [Nocardia terpenica]